MAMMKASSQVRDGGTGVRAFTLVEMVTAVSLLVIVIMAVGMVFRDAGKAVGLAQASGELFSNVRGVEYQLEQDVGRLDRAGCIVIRSRENPADSALPQAQRRRLDQLGFLATGNFANKTGSIQAAAVNGGPFVDSTESIGAWVWYGHGVRETTDSAVLNAGNPPNQAAGVYANALPSGSADKDFVVCRRALLLLAANRPAANQVRGLDSTQQAVAAYAVPVQWDAAVPYRLGDVVWRVSNQVVYYYRCTGNPSAGTPPPGTGWVAMTNGGTQPDWPLSGWPLWTDQTVRGANGESALAHPMSSRIGAFIGTPGQLMTWVMGAKYANPASPDWRFEADNLCWRSKFLLHPLDTEVQVNGVPGVTNGYFRMTPVLLEGVSHFAVDWTDGNTDATGALRWFGLTNRAYGNSPGANPAEPALANGDDYTAIFSFNNRASWPKALRITYRVTDSRDRLNGGRTFVQVLKLPE